MKIKRNDAGDLVGCEVNLSILGYQEEGEWVAVALEMDLRGYGKTFSDACAELQEIAVSQIQFAILKGQPEMILKSAEPHYFELFSEIRREKVLAMVMRERKPAPRKKVRTEPRYDVCSIPFPNPDPAAAAAFQPA